MALKLDMSKAYDRVEWQFLEMMMLKMGFSSKWVKSVMSYVSSVSYSFMLNGSVYGKIKPSRGLRQREPLSFLLFTRADENNCRAVRNVLEDYVRAIGQMPLMRERNPREMYEMACGKGNEIKVYKDNWIPSFVSLRVLSPPKL
ncbi:hypothetical protein Ddye_005827 [Dipteronia dyeriana]|uniref:Reverse transcriptase n=1 Tax=Dipteronia dyeriana TaxID=168575 RepID=A0AAD9XGZ8_9ROSI|nr:hypothetical protein Ddye_005827 [Dipteronia dyeriana]